MWLDMQTCPHFPLLSAAAAQFLCCDRQSTRFPYRYREPQFTRRSGTQLRRKNCIISRRNPSKLSLFATGNGLHDWEKGGALVCNSRTQREGKALECFGRHRSINRSSRLWVDCWWWDGIGGAHPQECCSPLRPWKRGDMGTLGW